MRHYTPTILGILTVLFAPCCQKESARGEAPVTEINLSIPGTKVALGAKDAGSYPLYWQSGDRVIINGTAVSEALDASFAGQATATFVTTAAVDYPLSIVYPSAVKGDASYILIPAEQNYNPGKLANGYGVLAGYSSSAGAIVMKHLCGYIKIPVTGSGQVARMTLRALGGELLAGRFRVDFQTGSLSPVTAGTAVESASAISIQGPAELSPSSTEFVFAVPGGLYSSGFEFTVEDGSGNGMTKTMYSSTGKSITAGIVTEMPALAYSAAPLARKEFSISETACDFPATGYASKQVSVCTYDEPVSVSSTGAEWLGCFIPSEIPAGRTLSMDIVPGSVNICDSRSGSITFTGKQSGLSKTVSISQSRIASPSGCGFPAKWEIYSSVYGTSAAPTAAGKMWMQNGYATATNSSSVSGTAYLVAASTKGNPLLTHTLNSDGCLAVGGMDEGDYIEFCAPVEESPAGTDYDLMITVNANNKSLPKYWLLEYWDGGEWKQGAAPYTAAEDPSLRYSCTILRPSSSCYRTLVLSFTLQEAVRNGFVRVRLRAVGKINGSGTRLTPSADALLYFAPMTYEAVHFISYAGAPAVKDTKKILVLGNSFTYYFGSAFMLKEIARREGHQLDMKVSLKGSNHFYNHLYNIDYSIEAVQEGGYDFAMLQDGTYFAAEYGLGDASAISGGAAYTPEQVLQYTKEMTSAIKASSPAVKTMYEICKSSPTKLGDYNGFGSYASFDERQLGGAFALAGADPNINWLNPVGVAAKNARDSYGFTSSYNYLNYTDNFHPSRECQYLKACCTYMRMYAEDLTDSAATCGISGSDAAKLRRAASDAALKDRNKYIIR